ncbi:hypothetical protein PMAYCL1PPCAC_26910, partial [Pristionchus mayeri]
MAVSQIALVQANLHSDSFHHRDSELKFLNDNLVMMYYCLLKVGDDYVVCDRQEIKGPELAWGPVQVKKGKTLVAATAGTQGETAPSLKKSVILSIISYEYKCLGVKYGIYEGLTEERVDALDDEDDNCFVFAGNLDRLLFKKSPLPHQHRDQDKVKWLIEVVTHRRCQGPGREKRRMKTQILQRINVNAKR